MKRTILVVVDTMRADEVPVMGRLLERDPHVCDGCWAVAPYTLPAMTSLVTGKLPTDHGVWERGSGRRQTDTIAMDWPSAAAVSGRGYADGNAMGYATGFRAWRTQHGDARVPQPHAVPRGDLALIHTFTVHNYIFDRWAESDIHAALMAKQWPPMERLRAARAERIRRVESAVLDILDASPDARLVLTADHGEALEPPLVGHGLTHPPSAGLLRLPFLVLNGEAPPPFLPQHQIRSWLRGEPVQQEPVTVHWPKSEQGDAHHFRVGPAGLEVL